MSIRFATHPLHADPPLHIIIIIIIIIIGVYLFLCIARTYYNIYLFIIPNWSYIIYLSLIKY